MDIMEGITSELSDNLKDKVVRHRQRFVEIFKARYLELLPSLIHYKNGQSVNVDWLKVEVALRSNYNVVIGETSRGNIQVIGYVRSQKTSTNPADLFNQRSLDGRQINFVIPKHLRLPYYKEITDYDSGETGNFVVLRNKTLNYTNDYVILDHYTEHLGEIELSRYSISMQVKISTIFMDDVGNETVNEVINDLYNGNPYIKLSKLFDPEEQIYHMQNQSIANNFQELKREFQNKLSELNNMLGMNSLAVEKESGVSDEEARSNRAYTTSNANIYLDARNNGLRMLNKRYGLSIQAQYNDEVQSEFAEMAREEDTDNGGNN